MRKVQGEDGDKKFTDIIEDGRRVRLYNKARTGYLYAGDLRSVRQVRRRPVARQCKRMVQ